MDEEYEIDYDDDDIDYDDDDLDDEDEYIGDDKTVCVSPSSLQMIRNCSYSYYYYKVKRLPGGEFREKRPGIWLTAADSQYLIYAKDGKSRELRPICYSDFLILTRKADIDEYRYGLKSAGIPVTWAGKVDISSERILRKVQILLNGLVEIRDKVKRTGAIDLLNDDVTSGDTTKFDDLYEKTKKLGIMGKLRYIADHLSILPREPGSNDDIQQVYQMVESVYGAACDNPTTVLSYIEDYIGRELDYELPLDEKEMKGSVRLMNVHKAKGLEGHIVIIANRGNDMSRNKNCAFMSKDSSGSYVWNGTVPIGYGDYSEEIGLQKIDGTPENGASKVEEDAENLRLEYVAGTRAEEALIVMNEMVQTGRAFFGKKNDADGGYTDYKDFDTEYPDMAKGSITIAAQASVNSTTIRSMRDDVDAAEISLTPSSLENRSSGRVESKEDRPSGNVFGTVMHGAFELSVNSLTENKSTALEDVILTAVRRAVMESYDKLSREGSPRGWTPEWTAKYLAVDSLLITYILELIEQYSLADTTETVVDDRTLTYATFQGFEQWMICSLDLSALKSCTLESLKKQKRLRVFSYLRFRHI